MGKNNKHELEGLCFLSKLLELKEIVNRIT